MCRSEYGTQIFQADNLNGFLNWKPLADQSQHVGLLFPEVGLCTAVGSVEVECCSVGKYGLNLFNYVCFPGSA